ncbi:MAG: hypothetical protein OXG81_13750 [Acidobacteria bacterium]|nr:hypothetical protein [Acidobacteriota bacterium]
MLRKNTWRTEPAALADKTASEGYYRSRLHGRGVPLRASRGGPARTSRLRRAPDLRQDRQRADRVTGGRSRFC